MALVKRSRKPVPRRGLSADAFCAWLVEMKEAGLAKNDADCGRLLDISSNSVVTMKKRGADHRTALACRALMHRMEPWGVNLLGSP